MPRTSAFSPSQLRELRTEMEQDFARLLRSMGNEQAATESWVNDAWSAESPSEPDELDAVLQERAHARFAAISAALRRIDTGAYGECVRCGSCISFDRLAVMPEATLCIACGGN